MESRKQSPAAVSVLLVDDRPDHVKLAVQELEQEGFAVRWTRVETEKDFREALGLNPDIILADYSLPGFDGMAALKIKNEIVPEVPLVILSGTLSEERAVECMRTGAADYVLIDRLFRLAPVVKRAIREAGESRERRRTEVELHRSFEKLQKTMEGVIQAMSMAIETRDPYTAGHQRRVAEIACAMAGEMGLEQEKVNGVRMAGVIHDLGKLYVPAEILSKPGRLTDSEFAIIKAHPQVGYDILKGIEFSRPIAQIVLQHHERINGTGYPAGLSDSDILFEARIIGVADVVEAMASHRPYRPALGIDRALDEISSRRGELYDSRAVDACLEIFNRKGFRLE